MFPIIEIIQFAAPLWLINMSLNLIYIVKLYSPKVKSFDRPLDAQKSMSDGSRILGNSTTWLGIVVALCAGLIVQNLVKQDFEQGVLFGIVSGLSVYLGHAIGSFIKRRFKYQDGEFMPFVDHADYVIFSGIVFGLLGVVPWSVIGVAILVTYIVHPIVTYLSYLLKLHKHPL